MTKEQVAVALAALQVTPEELAAVQQSSSTAAGRAKLAAIVERARVRYKELARQLHPDVTHGDAAKEALFVSVTLVWRDLAKVRVEDAAPMPARGSFTGPGLSLGIFRRKRATPAE